MNTKRYFPIRGKGISFIGSIWAAGTGLGLALELLFLFSSHNPWFAEAAPLPAALRAIAPADFTVNTASDSHDANPGDGNCADSDGLCSLRAAIEESNGLIGPDIIQLPTNNYLLVYGQLAIADNLEIDGAGSAATIIDAQGNSRVFQIDKPGGDRLILVKLSGLTIQHGNTSGDGGGIWNNERLALVNSSIVSNTAVSKGGGILSTWGSLTITNSTVGYNWITNSSNAGCGAGIHTSHGDAALTQTEIISNDCFGLFSPSGGGIYNSEGSFRLADSIVDNNVISTTNDETGIWGAGIYNNSFGNFTITHSTISQNTIIGLNGMGGGIYNWYQGNILITGSEINQNTSSLYGGGIVNSHGNLSIMSTTLAGNAGIVGGAMLQDGTEANCTIENSTIRDNYASESAGGVYFFYGKLALTNSTVSSNVAATYTGGGFSLSMGTILTLTDSTVAMNSAPGGGNSIYNSYGAIHTKNTILDDDVYCVDPATEIDSHGYNLIRYTNCTFTPAEGDISGLDPLLAPLADNGGKTFTNALLSGSPAIDSGNCTDMHGNPVMTDQRGASRPQGHSCDIGAYELVAGLSLGKSVYPAIPVMPGSPITYTVSFQNNSLITHSGVLITDVIPAYLHDLAFSSSGVVITPTDSLSYTWQVANLAPRDGGMITITGIVNTGLPAGFVFTNTASITTTIPDTYTAGYTDQAATSIANAPPTSADDSAITWEDTPVLIPVLDNDFDLNGDALRIIAILTPAHGTAVISGMAILYTPSIDYNGSDAFSYTISDGSLTATAGVTVTILPVNDSPIVEAGPDQSANEGDLLYFTGIITDVDDTAFDVAWNLGDGASITGTLTPTHTFLDEGIYTVTLTVTDTHGDVGSDALLVSVANIAPVLGSLEDKTILVGQPLTLSISFTDPGLLDTHTIRIWWSEAISETIQVASCVYEVNATHIFTAPGDYTVTVTVLDDSGASGTGRFRAVVLDHYPVYLPVVIRPEP